MNNTPPIPQSIRGLQVEGYTNVYEIVPTATRLYGTESLFGDWNAPLLLLAQDFAHASFVRERVDSNHPDPYSHKDGLRTNDNLIELSKDAVRDGALYGSALGPLLKNGNGLGASLPNRARAMQAASTIVRFTIDNMPNLRVVVCLGTVAWEAIYRAYLRETSVQSRFIAGSGPHTIEPRRLAVFVTAHTSSRGLNNRREVGTTGLRGKQLAIRDWQAINRYLFPMPDH